MKIDKFSRSKKEVFLRSNNEMIINIYIYTNSLRQCDSMTRRKHVNSTGRNHEEAIVKEE